MTDYRVVVKRAGSRWEFTVFDEQGCCVSKQNTTFSHITVPFLTSFRKDSGLRRVERRLKRFKARAEKERREDEGKEELWVEV